MGCRIDVYYDVDGHSPRTSFRRARGNCRVPMEMRSLSDGRRYENEESDPCTTNSKGSSDF